jgi:tellurium resistance protein
MRKQLPIYICIDTSGSMHGERITTINAGLQALLTSLRQDPYALEIVHLAITTFDSQIKEVLPLTPLMEVVLPEITCGKSGATFLGGALETVVHAVRRDLTPWNSQTKNAWGWYPDYAPYHHGVEIHGDGPPNLIIITDGKPSDPLAYSEAIPHIKELDFDNIIVCGIGKKIDFASLRQLTETIVLTDEINADNCAEFFIWAEQTMMRYIRWADDLPVDVELPILPPPAAPAGFYLLPQSGFSRRLPIYLCIDTSGSMRGEPIKMVNDALQILRSALSQDPYMLDAGYLSIITFDMQVREVLPLTPIEILSKYGLPEITCPGSGSSLLGAALECIAQIVARNAIRNSPEQKGDWDPILFIFTNGKLNDPLVYDAAIPLIKSINFDNITVFVTSSKADITNLRRLTEIICSLETADIYTIKSCLPKWVS